MSIKNTYKLVEIVGTSRDSVDEAITNGVTKAAESLRNLNWFQVSEIRGRIVNNKVEEFQAIMKVGFRIE
jgi:flavin-binding protein dodecin